MDYRTAWRRLARWLIRERKLQWEHVDTTIKGNSDAYVAWTAVRNTLTEMKLIEEELRALEKAKGKS